MIYGTEQGGRSGRDALRAIEDEEKHDETCLKALKLDGTRLITRRVLLAACNTCVPRPFPMVAQ